MTIKPFKTVKLHFSIGVLLIHGELIGLELQWLAVVVAREAPHDVGCGRLLGWQLSRILGNTWDVMGIWKESHEIYCGYNGDLMINENETLLCYWRKQGVIQWTIGAIVAARCRFGEVAESVTFEPWNMAGFLAALFRDLTNGNSDVTNVGI